jgi:hypothetical protein
VSRKFDIVMTWSVDRLVHAGLFRAGARGRRPGPGARRALLVAPDEGLEVLEYAKQAGVAQSLMSRDLLDLLRKRAYQAAGLQGVLTNNTLP